MSKLRNAIEKLWASVRVKQTRRKQGKSVGNCGLLCTRGIFFLVQPFALQTNSLLGGISPIMTNNGTNQGERATEIPNVHAAACGVNSQTDGVNLINKGVDDSTRTEIKS
nr:hypothetical protein [Tanacetum cinerariifolium]